MLCWICRADQSDSLSAMLMNFVVPFNRYQHQSLERYDAFGDEPSAQLNDF